MASQEGISVDQTVSSDLDLSEATHDILDTAAADGRFTRLVAAIRETGLEGMLGGPDPITLLAPVDEAMSAGRLPDGFNERIAVLRRHVLRGAFTTAELRLGKRLNTLGSAPVSVAHDRGETTIEGARIVAPDILCTNGVLHGIDRIIG